jgi:ubiquinone/menaquinone biosynthesis C-methylase UbiE
LLKLFEYIGLNKNSAQILYDFNIFINWDPNMNEDIKTVKEWYNSSYSGSGFNAQRRYPNEEMLRFFGRNLLGVPVEARKDIHILEVGCGSCSNLWFVAKEGFDAHGVDLSPESIKLGKKMLGTFGVSADLKNSSMTDMPYADASFDIILDVFSSYCLNERDFHRFLFEIRRVLKPGAKFFSYFPSKESDAFINHSPAELLDQSTLNGIYRKDSCFFGNYYPFRFMHPDEYKDLLNQSGFYIDYLETVTRTYRYGAELFQHIVVEGRKK